MANRAIPYPDAIHRAGERAVKRIMDEFRKEQSVLFRKEEEEKKRKKEQEVRSQNNACGLAGTPALSEAHK